MSEQLQILIELSNKLDDKQKDEFMKHISFMAFFPEKEIFYKFKALCKEIVKLISEGHEKDIILHKLTVAGMEEEVGNIFFKYCSSILNPLRECQIINSLELDGLKNIMNFIINKMFIYREYMHYPFSTIVTTGNFRNKAEAQKVLRFLHKTVFQVARRDISPDTLKLILLNDYDLSPNSVDIITDLLKSHASELHQAQLFYTIDEVDDKLEELLEDEDEDENEEVAEED